jgi:iron complex transport system permease protein
MSRARRRLPAGPLGVVLLLLLPVLVIESVRTGTTGTHDFDTTWRGCLAAFGFGTPLEGHLQTIVELRLWRALTAAGVGAALALSGALIQGLFRNGLASPTVLGVTGGACLGASLAILLLGGYGSLLLRELAGPAALLVPLGGFLGAVTVVTVVTLLGSPGGRVSVPTLLLTGIAVNIFISGVLALISSLVLEDWEVSRAILAWSFGTLDDRSPMHVVTVWTGVAAAALIVPFVAWELDLFQAGEEDALALGVNTGRVRVLCVVASSLAAAAAVAVAGQISFVGLVVPHLVRLLCGRGHRAVLPLSLLLGPVFLLAVDLAQRSVLGERALQPGVMMSLVGGPFFLILLIWRRKEVGSW